MPSKDVLEKYREKKLDANEWGGTPTEFWKPTESAGALGMDASIVITQGLRKLAEEGYAPKLLRIEPFSKNEDRWVWERVVGKDLTDSGEFRYTNECVVAVAQLFLICEELGLFHGDGLANNMMVPDQPSRFQKVVYVDLLDINKVKLGRFDSRNYVSDFCQSMAYAWMGSHPYALLEGLDMEKELEQFMPESYPEMHRLQTVAEDEEDYSEIERLYLVFAPEAIKNILTTLEVLEKIDNRVLEFVLKGLLLESAPEVEELDELVEAISPL